MLKHRRRDTYCREVLGTDHAAMLAEHFALDVESVALTQLEGGEDNVNVVLRDPEGTEIAVARHYLITRSERVMAELRFVEFLHEQGFPTPPPIPTADGRLYLDGGDAPSIAMFPFIAGVHVDTWSGRQLRRGGRVLAQMHMLCDRAGYRIGRTKDRFGILRAGLEKVAATGLADKALFIDAVETFLAQDLPPHADAFADLPSGPIHHDMNPGNVFWRPDGGFGALIDFDEAHDAPYIVDIVSAMHYLATDVYQVLDAARCAELLAGYGTVRPLGGQEITLLQFSWDLLNIVGAMEFIAENAPDLESVMECRSFSGLYLKNRQALTSATQLLSRPGQSPRPVEKRPLAQSGES